MKNKIYYIADSEHIDQIYGDLDPVCVTLAEIERLAREWDMTTDELLEQFHEATDEEIEQFGTYDTPAPKYFTADREAGNIIAGFKTYAEAKQAVAEYEEEDRREGNYTPGFYDIVDHEHCTIEED